MTVCHVDLIGPATDPCNTGAILDVLCPMHLVLNKTGHIIHVGPTLIKIRESEDWLGKRFLEVFSLKRPRSVNSAQDLEAVSGSKLHLQLRDPPTTNLKGVLVPGHIAGQLIVNLSFGISAVDAVRDYELTNTDFAPTDLTIEMLYLVEAKSAAMEASRKLNLRLQGAMIAAEEQAFTDTLTGLKNRRAFDMIIERHLVAGTAFALMQIDLDFFKTVNDSYGHAAGDQVLQTVARIMVAETRDADTVARLGGDEFVILFPKQSNQDVMRAIGQRIISSFEKPIQFQDKICKISASIGTVFKITSDTATAKQLYEQADIALYASKRAGRGCQMFYLGDGKSG
ncbi:MAG: diguanylate cyclase [Ascidiaceihabitans sp.]|nr:diguanylate cyclase [Ascidiaceihabitans sp.]